MKSIALLIAIFLTIGIIYCEKETTLQDLVSPLSPIEGQMFNPLDPTIFLPISQRPIDDYRFLADSGSDNVSCVICTPSEVTKCSCLSDGGFLGFFKFFFHFVLMFS